MKIFVGWDSREDIAYQVCKHSILARSNGADVVPLVQDDLRKVGLYTRDIDPLSSTEFTFTRFLIPEIMNYEGWALFCDCDIIFLDDIKKLFDQADDKYAVMCVHHDYKVEEGMKMDGKVQHVYPRKNWSSVFLINCGHPSNKALTRELVNNETGKYLHRFSWLDDSEVGEISHEWNWLVGVYSEPKDGKPKAIHYTEGGPWFENYMNCEYGAYWEREKNDYQKKTPIVHKYDRLPDEINSVIDKILKYRVDSKNEYYPYTAKEIGRNVTSLAKVEQLCAIDSEFRYERKSMVFDPILENFILGSGGQITTWDIVQDLKTPVILRGIAKRRQIFSCQENGRDFYYIDTGYFGNGRRKLYHRVAKNALQATGPVIHRSRDRLTATGWQAKKFTSGRNILLCPPSAKVMKFFDLDLDQWMEETLVELRKHTDREIVIRLKQSRAVRITTDTMESALEKDVHCLVTFNSIAATEALLFGKPAITLGPNAAQSLCKQSLLEIENPYIPSLDEVEEWAAHLAYSQFTEQEMRSGYAWKILNENSDLSSSSSKE